MNYYVIEITPPQLEAGILDVITALISDMPFESFEETEMSLKAYIPEKEYTQDVEKQLFKLSKKIDFTFNKTLIPYQNWNEIWETHFHPIQVDDFVAVRADFHPPTEGVVFDLIINPKMAFGTGHHETTHMMMQMMRDVDFNSKKVFDYGCGTGILAILASKLRATHIVAVDIEEPSYDNTIENSRINNVENITAYHGTLEAVPVEKYDIILANINRNVILNSLNDLKNRLNPGGLLMISGFLKDDFNIMTDALKDFNFTVLNTLNRGNWLCFLVNLN
jgi:ribosomal protein L11 methyltransferase